MKSKENEIKKLQRAVIYLAKELEDPCHDNYLHKNKVLDILELEEIRDIPYL